MEGRGKHTEGFTLAELLLSIAIILVLATMAMPSIVAAQSNMRMLELNNAAEAIANAAQAQMTAQKVSGTWLALIEATADDGSTTPAFPLAKNPPSGSIAADTYYMTADEARSNGIVPSLSVDDTVRNGDYIIEFTASTAQVVSVFFTDDKAGFFADAPESTHAAQDYYTATNGSADARQQAARKAASPMIGYYAGTPAGATPAVALKHPVIWMDEDGHLLVQNANLLRLGPDGTAMSTSVELVITSEDNPETSIVIGGLDQTNQSYAVGITTESDDQHTLSNSGETKVVELVAKSSGQENDVFSIDLNEFANVVAHDAGAADVAEVVAKFTAGEKLRVDARVAMTNTEYESSATAFVEWPAKVAKLRVLVTNPAIDAEDGGKALAKHIGGTFTAPKVSLVAADTGDPASSAIISMKPDQEIFEFVSGTTDPEALPKENPEANRQSYSGGNVSVQKARDTKANVKVETGSYEPDGSTIDTNAIRSDGKGIGKVTSSTTTHQYQIYELWINDQRVGYLDQGTWKWEEGDLAVQFSSVISWDGGSTFTIDTEALYQSISQTEEGYEIYVRTTPNSDEVHEFFDEHAKAIANYLSWGGSGMNATGTTGSRGVNRGAPIRQPFENEFGAPSTVALWNLTTTQGNTVFTTPNGTFPSKRDMRVYYSATPAVAWSDLSFSEYSAYSAVPSAMLWLYRYSDSWAVGEPQAYVRDSRTKGGNFKLTKGYDGANIAADFEIAYNRDYLFYRVLSYVDEDGKPLSGYPDQYVPYTVQDEKEYATIQPAPEKEGYDFLGWKVEKKSTYPENKEFVIPAERVSAGTVVADYDDLLAYGAVTLVAQYKEIPKVEASVGLMYLEFDGAGAVTGSSGSLNGQQVVSNLPDQNEIATWGYYVVVPQGAPAPAATNSDSGSAVGSMRSIVVSGVPYDAYQLVLPTYMLSNRSQVVTCKLEGATYTYYCNVNFAAAVTLDKQEAKDWGDDEPWIVRHVDQFPTCLEVNNLQPAYFKDEYRQAHAIDFAGKNDVLVPTVFSGEYDGGGFHILNFDLSAVRTYSEGWIGLFPRATGAEFSNVNLDVVSSSKNVQVNGDSVGMFVGIASDCEFETCAVRGMQADGSIAQVNVAAPKESSCYVGAFVGNGDEIEIEDCVASDLDVRLMATYPSNYQLALGGLAGYLKNSVLDVKHPTGADVVASNIKLTAQGDAQGIVGGIVGKAEKVKVHSGQGNTPFRDISLSMNGIEQVATEILGEK